MHDLERLAELATKYRLLFRLPTGQRFDPQRPLQNLRECRICGAEFFKGKGGRVYCVACRPS